MRHLYTHPYSLVYTHTHPHTHTHTNHIDTEVPAVWQCSWRGWTLSCWWRRGLRKEWNWNLGTNRRGWNRRRDHREEKWREKSFTQLNRVQCHSDHFSVTLFGKNVKRWGYLPGFRTDLASDRVSMQSVQAEVWWSRGCSWGLSAEETDSEPGRSLS